MTPHIEIGGRRIGRGSPVYIVAELSANHSQSFDEAVRIVYAAREAGADAVKVQTYTPDTLTLQSERPEFRVGKGTLWEGKALYDLYEEAFMPWDWQPRLKEIAQNLGLHFFSTAFDFSSVEFLEKVEVPAYKIASFEIVDLPLIRRVASAGKPMILSTGMASVAEIEEALEVSHSVNNHQIALLKCTSAYPASAAEMHLRTLCDMEERFNVCIGLSDHTLGTTVPVVAVSLGAAIVEKHFTLSRSQPGPDSPFSLEPAEFRNMVDAIREAELAIGSVSYGATGNEINSLQFRRSLFVIEDLQAGDPLTEKNIRSVRPANGLPPRYYEQVLGRRVIRNVARGTPLSWDLLV